MNNMFINNKEYNCYNSFVQDKYANKINVIFATTPNYWWEDIINDFDITKIIPFDYDMCGCCDLWEPNNIELSFNIINKLNEFINNENPIYVYGNNTIIIISEQVVKPNLSNDLRNFLKLYNIDKILIYNTIDTDSTYIDYNIK